MTVFLRRLCSLVVVLLFSSISIALANNNRTIYHNGKVFTADSNNPWAEGVVTQGRFIIAVGSDEDVMEHYTPGTTLVDLQGKTMIPGLNDAHVHPSDNTSFPRAALLNTPAFVPGPGPTFNDVLNLIQAAAATQPAGKWLFVFIGENVVNDPNANRFNLDTVSPNHPVLLSAWYGHGTFFNTKAMTLLGIGEQEPDPVGGFYQRMPNSNIVKGVAHEYAEHKIRRYFANQMTNAEFKTLYENFDTAAKRLGYTSVQEFSVGLTQQRHLSLLKNSNLSIRWNARCFPITINESCDVAAEFSPLIPFTKLRSSGLKWIADGSPIERLAYWRNDYADAPGVRGQLDFTINQMRAQVARSNNLNAIKNQYLVHAVGDAAIDTVMDLLDESAPDAIWKLRRPRIEHGYGLHYADIDRAKRLGLVIVENPIHFGLAELTATRLGSTLDTTFNMKSILDKGARLAIGSDAVAAVGNPYLDIFLAVVHPTRPSEAITVEQAVTAYTLGAAFAEFSEAWKGSIEVFKAADLVVLSQDIFTVSPPTILSTESVLTVVDGNVVYDAGVL